MSKVVCRFSSSSPAAGAGARSGGVQADASSSAFYRACFAAGDGVVALGGGGGSVALWETKSGMSGALPGVGSAGSATRLCLSSFEDKSAASAGDGLLSRIGRAPVLRTALNQTTGQLAAMSADGVVVWA